MRFAFCNASGYAAAAELKNAAGAVTQKKNAIHVDKVVVDHGIKIIDTLEHPYCPQLCPKGGE